MKKSLILIIFLLLASVAYANDDFDCSTLGISLDKCSNLDGVFKAEFSVLGTKAPGSYGKVIDIIKGIEYTLDTEKQYKTFNGDIVARGTLPEGYKLTSSGGNNYVLEANMGDNVVKSLRVAYTKDDLYEYTFEMERCYMEASDLKINMYGFKMCEVLKYVEPAEEAKVEDNKATAKVVAEVPKTEEKNNVIYYVLGGIIVLVVAGFFIFRKKRNTNSFGN